MRCTTGLPTKSKLFLVIFINREVKFVFFLFFFASSVVVYLVPGNVLIGSSNETVSGEVPAI